MKNLLNILILTGLASTLSLAQVAHKATTTSQGGGSHKGGTFENTYIIGNTTGFVTGSGTDNVTSQPTTYETNVGFLAGGNIICNLPLSLASVVTGETSADLSWDPALANQYQIRYRVAGSTVWVDNSITTTSLTLNTLSPGTDYQWQLRVSCSTDNAITSPWSEVLTFTTNGATTCNIPTNLSTSAIGDNTASLIWDDMSATSYDIRYKLDGTFNWVTLSQGGLTQSQDLTGLDAGSQYFVQVRSVCDANGALVSEWQDLILNTTGTPPCEIPTNVIASNFLDNSFDVAWDAITSASSGYEYKYRPNGTVEWITGTTTNTTVSLTGLESGTEYVFTVRSLCNTEGTSVSEYSPFVTGTTTGTVSCEIPTGLTSPLVDDASAFVTWTSTGADLYTLRYRVKGVITWEYLNPSSNELLLSGLVSGITYEVQVQGLCLNAATTGSGYTPTYELTTTGVVPCEVPLGLNVSAIADNSATVSWTENGASSYQIRYKPANSYIYNTMEVTGGTTSLSGLQAGTDYVISIRAICAEDGSLVSFYSDNTAFSTTGGITCDTPDGLATNNITETGADVSWTAVASAQSYKLRYRKQGAVSWTFISTLSTTVNLSGLEAGTGYEFAVRAICSSDNSLVSDLSVISTFETNGILNCTPPLNVAAGAITDNSFDITWSPVTEASQYVVRYKADGAAAWEEMTVSTSSATITSLTPGTGYVFAVRSDCSGDGSLVSDYSDPVEVTTTGTKPCPVATNLTVLNIADNSADFSYVGGGDTNILQFKLTGVSYWSNIATTGSNGPDGTLNTVFLSSGSEYSVRILSQCNGVNAGYSNTVVFNTTGASPCDVVNGLELSNITSNSVDVSFTGNASADLEVWTQTSGAPLYHWKRTPVAPGTTSASLTGLFSGMNYKIRVVTICSAYIDGHKTSETLYFTTDGAAECTPPTNLSAVKAPAQPGYPYMMSFSWTDSPSALSYTGFARSSFYFLNATSVEQDIVNVDQEQPWFVVSVCDADGSVVSERANSTYFYDTSAGARTGGAEEEKVITSVEEIDLEPTLNLYPNPFDISLSIDYVPESDQEISLDIFDLNGKLIEHLFEGKVTAFRKHSFEFEPNGSLPKGIYMYRLINKEGFSKTGRIIFK